MRLHRASEYRRSRWKNGKGETLEIAVHPPSATLDDFDWRISVALLEADASFSAFPGLDRTLTIIDGAGIDLFVDGSAHRLPGNAPPFRFSGDFLAHATLVEGNGADLSVMTRRDAVDHEVRRLSVGDQVKRAAQFAAIFAQSDVQFSVGGQHHLLPRWDLVELGEGEVALIVSGEAIEIRVDHRAVQGTLGAKPDESLR